MSADARPRLRARVREALVCPYCKDAVSRRGTVACARSACGALYHRECWEECSEQYGGCAVFGCESRRSREVSAAGFALRLVRLLVAAFLFPPRVVRALRSEERSLEVQSIWTRSRAFAKRLDPRSAQGWYAVLSFVVYLAGLPVAMVVGGFLFAGLLLLGETVGLRDLSAGPEMFVGTIGAAIVAIATVAGAVFSPIPGGFLLALGWNGVKLVASVLRSELGALARADSGDDTVLGRMRAGGGKKDEVH